MKSSFKYFLGIFLTALSLITFVIAVIQIIPTTFVDFPCGIGNDASQNGNSGTQIAYCVSFWPLKAISGGTIYTAGTTAQDEVTIDNLVLRREDEILYVNKKKLEVGEKFERAHWKLSYNPWLFYTTRISIKNNGIMADIDETTTSPNALYVSGDVAENWTTNPLGLVLLSIGVWQILRNKKIKKSKKTGK